MIETAARARRGARRHARRPARRCPAHPPREHHRHRLRPVGRRPPRLQQTSYEGPTGITGVLHHACAAAGIEAVSLWASVPHYVAATPNPKVALALVRGVRGRRRRGRSTPASSRRPPRTTSARSAPRWPSDPEVRAFVERLESAMDEVDEDTPPDIPRATRSRGDFQRFLRQRGPTAEPSALCCRADDPVVAVAADLRLTASAGSPGAGCPRRSRDRRAHAVELGLGVRDRDPLAAHHVPVAPGGGLQIPRLARAPSGRSRAGPRPVGRPPSWPRRSCSRSARTTPSGRRSTRSTRPRTQVGTEGEREAALEPHRLAVVARGSPPSSARARRRPARGTAARRRTRRTLRRQAISNSSNRSSRVAPGDWWKRSSTWCSAIPERWWIVGSCGMRKTRANLYLSGHTR